MINSRIRAAMRYLAAGALFLSATMPAAAQPQRQPVEVPAPSAFAEASPDARQTREDLKALLARYPPSLGRVLKLDPSLMLNDAYLASYPGLGAFLKQHPEIPRNPAYFLEFVGMGGIMLDYRQPSEAVQIWDDMMEGLTVFAVFAIIISAIIWLVKTITEHRRWSRQSKVQTDIHTKLFDRFSSNEDLLAYIQTPAGRRFLEGAPLTVVPPRERPLGAPVSRILWSVQAGIVIVAGGLGVLFVSDRVIDEVAQPLFAIASIGIALGFGFVISSVVAYGLSRSMGLLEPDPAARGGAGPQSGT